MRQPGNLSTNRSSTQGQSAPPYSAGTGSRCSPYPSMGGMPQMWEAATGKPLDTPLAESMKRVSNLESAVFSPDGRRLLTLFKNGAAQVWDTTTGKPLTGSIGRDAPIFSGIFSPDGKQVLTTSLGTSEAQVWDAASGKPLGEPIRHGGGIITGVFSPEGRRVLTASLDGTAQVWDAVTGKPLGQPMKHANRVNSAIFSPDGQHVLTASDDGTVRIWDSYWPSQPPECLADWSEAVGGWRLSDAGALISIDDPVEKLARLRESSAALPPDNPCALVAGWIFPSTASSR
jgi:WD40 repeat protein